MSAANIIIVVLLVIILIPAIRTSLTHMKGEGDCCGGPKEKVPKKKIDGQKLGDYIVQIEGMHCQNCKNRIERKLNELDGVVSKVNLEKKEARVSYYQQVDQATICDVIERLDFKVVSIRQA